jgi:aminocarboxymuconate-semialdehyde decarboxylase
MRGTDPPTGVECDPGAGPVIDVHAHAVPIGLLTELARHEGGLSGFQAHKTEDGWDVGVPGAPLTRRIRGKMTNSDLRHRWLADQGMSSQVLSPWMDVQPTAPMEPAAARDWARRLNTAMLEESQLSPQPQGAMASLALHDADQAASDLEQAVRADGMAGLLLNTNPAGRRDLADAGLEPLWAAAAELEIPVLLHPPTDGPSRALPDSDQFGNTYCRLVDTTFAVAKLVLSGVLDRHPGLQLVVVHGGGFLPYQSGRLDGGHRADGLSGYTLERGTPSAYLSSLWFDTVALSAPAVRFLTEAVGSDRVLLGSDYPFPLGDQTPVRTVAEAGLTAPDTAAVLGGNAATLFGRTTHA